MTVYLAACVHVQGVSLDKHRIIVMMFWLEQAAKGYIGSD